MDFAKVPIGFGMTLAQNETAMTAYAAMSKEQKQTILERARHAHSEQEMYQIVSDIANRTI